MQRRRVISWLAGTVVVLAACGSPSTPEPAAQPTVSATDAPATAPAETAPAATEAPAAEGSTATEATAAPASQADDAGGAEPAATDAPTATEAPAPIATQPPAATAAPGPAWPDDGCSVDNTATDVAAGPLPALEVREASASNPLPDVAVRRINCAGGWVNFKNELPSDKPLLVWFWAPH